MQLAGQKQISYGEFVLKTFTKIYYQKQDPMLNQYNPFPSKNPNQQQILFSQYPMQKKGKNFNKVQQRIFQIVNGVINQIDKNGQVRELPYPSSVSKEMLTPSNKSQWGFLQCKYRLLMYFEERNPILVYVRTKQQLNQLFSYLSSKIYPEQKNILSKASKRYFRIGLMNCLILSSSKIKISKNLSVSKNRIEIVSRISKYFSKQNFLKQMITQWHKRTVMTWSQNQRISQKLQASTLNVKNVVSQLWFSLQHLRVLNQYKIKKGELRLWIDQTAHNSIVNFEEKLLYLQPTYAQSSNKLKNQIFHNISIFSLKNFEFKLINNNPLLTIWSNFQFQIQALNEQAQIQTWRSERFHLIDLLKNLKKGPKKTITLWHKHKFILLVMNFLSAKNKLIKIQLPPQHETFPSSYTYKLTPNHYPILNEIISKSLLHKYLKSMSPETINLQYTIAYEQYLQTQSVQSLNFHNFHKLYDFLNIDAIIDKFYTTHPYSQYTNVDHKATFIYNHLAGKSEKLNYYDAEKFIWRYQCFSMRRFMSVIKAFDQFPRINYTQPFFYLCLKCVKLAEKQSLTKWKSDKFQNSLEGRQSLAFFLLLGLLKCSSQLLLYHTNKKILSNNSLLFHYVLKKQNRNLYNKFLQIQLNVQALFGIQSTSLFCGLFSDYSNPENKYIDDTQIHIFILNSFILERKQQQLQQQAQNISPPKANAQKDANPRTSHYISLVSVFLAILQLFDCIVSTKTTSKNKTTRDQIVGNSVAYTTPNCFLEYLRIFVRTKLQLYMLQLTVLYRKYYSLCERQFILQAQISQNKKISELKISQYVQLYQSLNKFYDQNQQIQAPNSQSPQSANRKQQQNLQSINSMSMGQLLQKLYSQFMCYKHKNQSDIRKICMIIDNINLGQYFTLPNSNINNNSTTNISPVQPYRPSSLIIQLLQQNTKLYEHEYVLNTKKNCENQKQNNSFQIASSLHYQNIKHIIQVKLNRLSNINLVISYVDNSGKSNTTMSNVLSFCCTIDVKQIPSNYYIQLVKELNPVNLQLSNGRVFIDKKFCDIDFHRYVTLQTYIKDSCDVDYLQNMVPNQYINLLLLRNRIFDINSDQNSVNLSNSRNPQVEEDYKKDIIFCNHYFKSYRLTQNNFNLLYAKLGWYGNHYLIPVDRLNNIYRIKNNLFSGERVDKQNQANNPETISKVLSNSIGQVQTKQLPAQYRQRINEILFYCRCIYGRGVIPSINHPFPISNTNTGANTQIVLQSVRRNKIVVRQCKELKHQVNQYQYNSCGNLMAYLFDNFTTVDNNISSPQKSGVSSSYSSFTDFYIRATYQLPLIRYLCYRPLQFYLLDQIRMVMKVPQMQTIVTHHLKGSQVQAKNYSSNPQHHGNSMPSIPHSIGMGKNKINSLTPQISKTESSPQYNFITSQVSSSGTTHYRSTKKFQIVLTNYPLIIRNANLNNRHRDNQPYKFITNPLHFNQQLYRNYNNPVNKQYDTRLLYSKLLQSNDIPSTMYFTYPEAIVYNWTQQGIQIIPDYNSVNDEQLFHKVSRQMFLDQFLWLLKMNILKYYILDNAQPPNSPGKSNSKSSSKQKKPKQANQNACPDILIKPVEQRFPNMSMADFYQMMSETKQPFEIIVTPIQSLQTNSSKSIPNNLPNSLGTLPIIMNPLYRHYTSYAHINNLWVSVCILARIVSPNFEFYYVEEKYTRKHRLMRNSQVVLGIQNKRLIQKLISFKFTDLQVISAKECVKKQLGRIL